MYKRTVSEYNVQSFYIELNYFRMCVLRIVENRKFHSHLSKEIESESVGALKALGLWKSLNLQEFVFQLTKRLSLKRMNYSYFYTFAQTWAIKRKCGKIRILKELKKLTINLWKKKKKTVNREYYAIERNSLPCMERYLITNQNFLLTPSHMNWNQKRVVLCHWGTLFGCRYRSMNKTAEITLWRYRQLSH